MKKLLETQKKDPKAKLAIKIFINSIVKYIGSYAALANGVDAVIFSG
jgi:acetate kinase